MNQIGPIHFVKNLDEAMMLWAAAAATNNPLPTFVTTEVNWPTWEVDIKNSYAVEHVHNDKTYRWSGVTLYVTAIKHPPTPTIQTP